jgi:hypothetical protein
VGLPQRRSRSLGTAVRCIHAHHARHKRTDPARFIVTESCVTYAQDQGLNQRRTDCHTHSGRSLHLSERGASRGPRNGSFQQHRYLLRLRPTRRQCRRNAKRNRRRASIHSRRRRSCQSRKALRTGPEDLKLRNQLELAQRVSEINHAREHLWTLQEHLREIEKPPAQQSVPTPNPQSQN